MLRSNQTFSGANTMSGMLNVTGNLQATSPTTTFLMTAFTDTDGASHSQGLILYSSQDGTTWNLAHKASWLYQVGSDGVLPTFRDPIIRKFGKYFYIYFTANFPQESPHKFGLVKSQDLVNWTNVATPDLSTQLAAATGATMIWNGEFIDLDGSKYLICNTAFAPADNYAIPFFPGDTDTFGTPIKITGTFPSTKCNIESIVKVGAVYYAQFTDYAGGIDPGHTSLGQATSSSPFSGYSSGATKIYRDAENCRAYRNLDGTPWISPAGKYRLVTHAMPPANANTYFDTADFSTFTSPVTIGPPYNGDTSALSISGNNGIHNVTITVANDFQTEQVLSALARDVLSTKVAVDRNNTFTGTNTFGAAIIATGSFPFAGVTGTSRIVLSTASQTLTGNNTFTGTNTFTGLYGANSFINFTGLGFNGYSIGFPTSSARLTYGVASREGTSDLMEQAVPGSSSSYYVFENAGVTAGTIISVYDVDSPIIFKIHHNEVGRFSSDGSSLQLPNNLVFNGVGKGAQFSTGAKILSGTGTPEGAIAAPVGSLYLRSDGGAGTTLYVKQSGSGNSGWTAK